jgi:crossover junction endodeoxyribonuclease RuvC
VRVLGIDPGLGNTGYGVIDSTGRDYSAVEGGVITTRAASPLEERLLTIFQDIRGVISANKPDVMAVEDLHSRYVNLKTAIVMGHARGVVCMAAAEAGIPVFNYQPTRAKNAVTGYGRASKEQIRLAVAAHLDEPDAARNEHVADAFAIAICHAIMADSKAVAAIAAAGSGTGRGRRKKTAAIKA